MNIENKEIAEFHGSMVVRPYHKDWNALMEVVHKIVDITSEHDQSFAGLDIFELGLFAPINEVHTAVLQFIKWHKNQTKH